jgi:UDP-N-acetylmuramate--alanine ligase
LESLKDPTIQVGATLPEINGNYLVGNSEYFIIEACEYVESFLEFSPKSEIILNIDNDHLDYYKSFDNIVKTFQDFSLILNEEGLLVTNADDENCLHLKNIVKSKFISYGIENEAANFLAKNITFNHNGFATFDIYKNGEFYSNIELSVAGKHNILNALACTAVCDYYGISKEVIASSLKQFTGAERRLEFKGNMENNASVFDDYAHHPTEIKATANAIKNKEYNETWVVFQPHTYSRTVSLLDEFAEAIMNFDHIIVLDIYAAREKDVYGISSYKLACEMKSRYPDRKIYYVKDFDDIARYLKKVADKDDIIMTMGAGDVYKIGEMILK